MMKRIPKGTLKISTSSLDGREPDAKSKRISIRGSKSHYSSSASTGTSRTVRSFKASVPAVTPTSPPTHPNRSSSGSSSSSVNSSGAHHATSFQFLRRPFHGSKSRKSSSVAKHMENTTDSTTKFIESTETSDDTASNTSHQSEGAKDGVLGIAAAPSFVVVEDSTSSNVVELVLNESTVANAAQSPSKEDDIQTSTTTTPSNCSPFQSLEDGEETPPSPIAVSPNDDGHPHRLGIQRSCYDLASTISQQPQDHSNYSFDAISPSTKGGGGDDDEQSEIVFEKDAQQDQESSTSIFEQSWMSDSETDLDPITSFPSMQHGHHPLSSPPKKSPHKDSRDTNHFYRPYAQYSSSPVSTPSTARKSKTTNSTSSSGKRNCELKVKSPSSSRRVKGVIEEQKRSKVTSWQSSASSCTMNASATPIKIFVLLLQPRNKIFELIQLTYPAETTTVGAILEMIPPHATEPALSSQVYVGLTRPKKRSPDFCDTSMYASYATSSSSFCTSASGSTRIVNDHNNNSIGLQSGETIVALPQGYGHHELVRLAKKILANPRIQQLLERSSAHNSPYHHGSNSKRGKALYQTSPESVNSTDKTIVLEADQDLKSAYEEGMKRAMANASVANAAVTSSPVETSSSSSKSCAVAKKKSLSAAVLTTPSVDEYLAKHQKHSKQHMASPTTASTSSCTTSQSSLSGAQKALPEATRDIATELQPLPELTSTAASSSSLDLSKVCVSSISKKHPSVAEDKPTVTKHEPLQSFPCAAASVSSSTVSSCGVRTPQHSVKTPKSLLGERSEAVDTLSLEGDLFEQWSQCRAEKRARNKQKRRPSFAALTISSPSPSVCSSSTSRTKRHKQRVAFVASVGRVMALLLLTMIARYYCDTKVVKLQRSDYDKPLGLLGGLQMFLLLHVLIKMQLFCKGTEVTSKKTLTPAAIDRWRDSPSVSSSRSRLG